MSNFEYIMRLNRVAGRSYNDIAQYPVMPWVLRSMTDNQLDLENPATFRDLSKPVGALNDKRLKEFRDRYNHFDDEHIPKFLYGSHYSTAGIVLHYLIRQEPFTKLNVNLQGGRFDVPDRIFFNMGYTWDGCNKSMSDVKELVPELYCCPEVLVNSNRYDLGELQDGVTRVDDVILPPWTKNNPFEFIRRHRDALESDVVSANLHHWIDLIFGYKQTGDEAVKADNVFYYLTYEDGVDLDAIEDQTTLEATKTQIMYFGQTPSQLFQRPHPARLSRDSSLFLHSLCRNAQQLASLRLLIPPDQVGVRDKHGGVVCMVLVGERLATVHSDLSLCYYRLHVDVRERGNGSSEYMYRVSEDKTRLLPSAPSACTRRVMVLRGNAAFYSQLKGAGMEHILDEGAEFGARIKTSSTSTSEESGLGLGSVLSAGATALTSVFTSDARSRTGSSSFGLWNSSTAHTDLEAYGLEGDVNESDGDGDDDERSLATAESNAGLGYGRHLASLRHNNIAINVDTGGMVRVVSGGYWDSSVKLHSLETLREIASVPGHSGQVTAVLGGGSIIVTGGTDGIVRIWQALHSSALFESLSAMSDRLGISKSTEDEDGESSPNLVCTHTLVGLVAPVSAMHYSKALDAVVSGSENGRICVHTASSGQLVRCVSDLEEEGHAIDILSTTHLGYVVAHTARNMMLHLFWINGQPLAKTKVHCRVTCMVVNHTTSDTLVCGMKDGSLSFRQAWDLVETRVMDAMCVHGAISSLTFSNDTQELLVGAENGTFAIVTDSDREAPDSQKPRASSPNMLI